MREIRDNNSMYTLNQDDIQMYLKDLRQIDVMTPEREKESSTRTFSTKYARSSSICLYRDLSRVGSMPLRLALSVSGKAVNIELNISCCANPAKELKTAGVTKPFWSLLQ